MSINTRIYLEYIRKIVFALPGTFESMCYGTEGFYVHKKHLLARMKEDGETLAMPVRDRATLIKDNPTIFYITDHYLNSNYVLIRLASMPPEVLKQLLLEAWLDRAPKTLVKEYSMCNALNRYYTL